LKIAYLYVISQLLSKMEDRGNKKVKICKICNEEFIPDKFHPYQEVCSKPQCQKVRQLENQKRWRLKNPDYFKYKSKKTPWERRRWEYLKRWRETHKDYFKLYRRKKKLSWREREVKSRISYLELPKKK